MGLFKKKQPTPEQWRFCREADEALAYIGADQRREKDYARAKGFILNDPLNRLQDRKRPRMTSKQWRELGLVYKYRVPSGWRFFYLVDPATKCVELLWAGSHDEADRLG